MSDFDRSRLFEPLEPPPGGAQRLRDRLVAARRRPARAKIRQLAAAGVAATLMLLLVSQLTLDPARQETGRTAPEMHANPETAQAPPDSADVAVSASPGDSLFDAPELDRLLGRVPAQVHPTVSIDGERASLVHITSSDGRVRLYMLAANSSDDP